VLGFLHWQSVSAIVIGSTLGGLIGYLTAFLFRRVVSLALLNAIERHLDRLLGLASLVLVLIGVSGYSNTCRLDVAIGTAFFAICGIYLLLFARERKGS
jgi:hypothetical protein